MDRFGNFRSEQKENAFPKGDLVVQACHGDIKDSVPDPYNKASMVISEL